MAGSQRAAVLCLYKKLLRESSKFVDYNYREYALRRVKDKFRENMITAVSVDKLLKQGQVPVFNAVKALPAYNKVGAFLQCRLIFSPDHSSHGPFLIA